MSTKTHYPAISIVEYRLVRTKLFEMGYRPEWEWAQNVRPPCDADTFAYEAIWVICCSGFKAQAARITEAAVLQSLSAGTSATRVFPKSGKGRAIDRIWNGRHDLFDEFMKMLMVDAPIQEQLQWIAKLPYVGGKILRYHFAKNLGIDCAKPDRWLCRLAGVPEDGPAEENFTTCMELCAGLSRQSGDRIATVDVVLWRACNLKIIEPLSLGVHIDLSAVPAPTI